MPHVEVRGHLARISPLLSPGVSQRENSVVGFGDKHFSPMSRLSSLSLCPFVMSLNVFLPLGSSPEDRHFHLQSVTMGGKMTQKYPVTST